MKTEETEPSWLTIDGTGVPGCVLPIGLSQSQRIIVNFGVNKSTCLKSVNAIVQNVRTSDGSDLECVIRSFDGHHIVAVITTPGVIKEALVDGSRIDAVTKGSNGVVNRYDLHFAGAGAPQRLQILLEGPR
jgi:hypothetical protein